MPCCAWICLPTAISRYFCCYLLWEMSSQWGSQTFLDWWIIGLVSHKLTLQIFEAFNFCWMWIFHWIKLSWHCYSIWVKLGWLKWFWQFLCDRLSCFLLSCCLCEVGTSFTQDTKLCWFLPMFSTGCTSLILVLFFSSINHLHNLFAQFFILFHLT